MRRICLLTIIASVSHAADPPAVTGEPWTRHVIDDTSRGADGARPFHINGDDWIDFVTPWEQGGEVRVYLHPGPELVREPWPGVTVGKVASPEDALCADFDRDGGIDVVSCTEGDNRSIYFHWAPVSPEALLEDDQWVTQPLEAAKDRRMWMFAVSLQIDGLHGADLFAGSKGEGAALGWFQAPANARKLDQWRWHPVRQAAWIMTIADMDMNGDNAWDIVYTERRGQMRGAWWLRHPDEEHLHERWPSTRISDGRHEIMFMTAANLDADADQDFVAATSGGPILWCEKAPPDQQRVLEEVWLDRQIDMPANTGTGKGVATGDIDGDGREDIVVACENAKDLHGLFWLSYGASGRWAPHDIGGLAGTKFDLVTLHDLDFDGDLDVITCEEAENLGVVWYENPYGPPSASGLEAPAPGVAPDAPVHVEGENEVIEGEEEGKANQSFIRRLFN